MYKYVGDISNLAHNIIKNNSRNFDIAIDATLGNGYDTDFLSELFKRVVGFEIQKEAIDNYNKRKSPKVLVINNSHEYLSLHCKEKVDCVMYNLGFLPGGDKNITTKAETTISSLKQALDILNPGGIVTVAIYSGHAEGEKEKMEVLDFARNLPKNEYGVMLHSLINRNVTAPLLLVIEKNLD